MNITVIPNLRAAYAAALTEPVCDILREAGAEVSVIKREGGLPNAAEIADALAGADIAVAIGGDGTLVHIAKAAATANRPVLGLNGGHLGFLAGLEKDEISRLTELTTGNYTVEERSLLSVEINSGTACKRYIAMNEAVVSRGALSKLVTVKVRKNEDTILDVYGDGVIFSTPTGSTAYSLSAGGPVIDPAVDCLLMTPVCPHSISDRPFVLPPQVTLTVCAAALDGTDVFLTVDGEENIAFPADATVMISKASQKARLIRLGNTTFYDALKNKIERRK